MARSAQLTQEVGSPTITVIRFITEGSDMPKIVDWNERFEQAIAQAPACACGCGEHMTPSPAALAVWRKRGGTNYVYRDYRPGHQNRNESHTLSNTEYQVLAGSALGDGCLHRRVDTYAPIFVTNHGPAQSEYVDWLAVQLAALNPKIATGENNGYANSTYVRLRTPAHYCLTPLLEERYPEPSTNLINSLESLGLAVWYMDDGTGGDDKVRLCTNGRTVETINMIRDVLLSKWGLKTSMHKTKVISFLGGSRQAFCNLVKPHIIPSMEYKLAWRRV